MRDGNFLCHPAILPLKPAHKRTSERPGSRSEPSAGSPGPPAGAATPWSPPLGSDVSRPAPTARSAAAASAGRPAGGGGGSGGGPGRGKMADGVDHIDIYADVGEEFNQVREGLGSATDADAAAAWTLATRVAAGGPRAGLGCRPCALGASGPRRCVSVCAARRPLTPCSRASFMRAAGSGARGPVAVQPPARRLARPPFPRGGLTPHCWLRRRALPAELGRVCGAGRTGRRAPSPAARLMVGGKQPWLARRAPARPPARPSPPSRPCRRWVPIPPVAPFCVSCRRTVALMEGRVHSPLYPARRVSRAPLLALATGFCVAPRSPRRGGKAA